MILDVGCGDRPKGHVNLDLYKGRTEHLQGYRSIINVKSIQNFVQGSIYNLPFKSNSIETVLCHHTLEHLKYPVQAVKELVRVARATVEVVVPYRFHEIVQNWFLPFRRKWMRKHHFWNFDKNMLEVICTCLKLNFKIKYRYKFVPVVHNFKKYRLSLKEFIIYGLLDTFFPPTPSELVLSINIGD